MAKDFRASQLEVKQIILSGGIAGKSNLGGIVYSGSIASDRAGTTAGPTLSVMLTNVGSDVLFFVSGSQTSGNPSAIGTGETVRSQVTLFGGDVVVSGTLYAERQVIEVDSVADGDFFVTGNMYVEPDTDSSESVAFRTAAGSNLFEIDSARHKIIMGGGSSKSLAPHNNAALTIVSASGADPEAEGGSKGNPSGYHTFFLTRDDTLNKTVGVAFGRKTATPNVGAAILHRRNGAYSRGSLEFYAKESDTFQSDLTLGLELSETGMALFHSGGHFGVPSSPNSLDPKTFTDTSFYVSGSRGSRGIPNSSGSAVFGGDLVVSGALHVMGNNTYNAGEDVAIVLDNTGTSRIIWDSQNDGAYSPDAQIYESGGDLYLSGSDDVRIRAEFGDFVFESGDDMLIRPGDALTISENSTATGKFVSIFSQPSVNTFENALDVDGEAGIIINDSGTNYLDFRVETNTKTHAIFTDAGNDRVLILSGGAVTSVDESAGNDVSFYVSGAIGDRGTAKRGTSVFGGDVYVSGALYSDDLVVTDDVTVGDDLTVNGTLLVAGEIQHSGDTDTKLTFTTDSIDISAGGLAGVRIVESASDSASEVVINTAGANLNFRVESVGESAAILVDSSANSLTINSGSSAFTTVINSGNAEAIRVDATGTIFNDSGNANNDFRVESNTKPFALFVSSSDDQVLIHSGGAPASFDEAKAPDVSFYVSGSRGTRGRQYERTTSVFGGDLVVSGALAISGSITDVNNPGAKIEFARGGTNSFAITCADNKQILTRDSAGTPDSIVINSDNAQIAFLVRTNSKMAIASKPESASANTVYINTDNAGEAGGDTCFWVSGSTGAIGTAERGTSVFGGDVVISGSLHGSSPLIIGSGLEVTGSVDLGTGLSGSLTHLVDGTSYIIAGDNITVATGSKGQLTIAGTGGSGFTRNSGASRVYLTENDDKLNIGGGNADPGGKVEITVSDTENIDGLIIDFNETGGKTALEIDSESTSGIALKSQGFKAGYFKQDISNGYGLYITRDLAEGGNEPLVNMLDNNANNTQATLQVRQDGTGPILRLRDGSAIAHEFKDGGEVVFNENGAATGDFRVESAGEDEAIFLDSSANSLTINSGSSAFTTVINSGNAEAIRVDATGTIFNDSGNANNDFRVESNTKPFALFVSSSDDQVLIHSGGAPASFDEAKAPDVSFYVSGSRGTRGRQYERTTSVFGGDLVVSGALAISGSITDVNNPGAKIEFARGGTNSFAITCADNKQILTRDSAGTPDSIVINSDNAQIAFLVRTNSKMAIASKPESASANTVYINTDNAGEAGGDTCFWVSGSTGAIGTAERGTSVFGGDVLISGSLRARQQHFTTHKLTPGNSTACFVRFDTEGSDGSAGVNNKMIAPYPGELLKVILRSTNVAGSTVVGLHTNTDTNANLNGTSTQDITVNMSAANTSYTFFFPPAANYGPNDIIGLKINPTNDPGTTNVTACWEFNTAD